MYTFAGFLIDLDNAERKSCSCSTLESTLPDQSKDDLLTQLTNLTKGDLKQVLHSVDYIQGIVFGVCACPEIPMPEQWLVWSFDQRGQLASTEQADKIADLLMGLLQHQLIEMREQTRLFPQHYELPELEDKESINSPTSEWLRGLLSAHQRLESIWQGCWEQVQQKAPDNLAKHQKDLKHCLLMFSTFADLPMAIEQAQRVGNDKLLDNLPKIFHSIPDALKTYVALSGELAQYLPEQFETFVQHK